MRKKLLAIDSCMLCRYESTDDVHDYTICANITPVREIPAIEIPEWCPLPDAPDVKERRSGFIIKWDDVYIRDGGRVTTNPEIAQVFNDIELARWKKENSLKRPIEIKLAL